jgi:hypothetical protein
MTPRLSLFRWPSDGDRSKPYWESERALRALAGLVGLGFLGVLAWSATSAPLGRMIAVAACGAMTGGAWLVIGGLLGFLFGIPRTLQAEAAEEAPPPEGQSQGRPAARGLDYRANTNLEQISDWLTKILVGVGLTQLGVIPARLQELASAAAEGMGGGPAASAFALAVILFFAVCGFLFSFLWTRLHLLGAFRRADVDALASEVREVKAEWERQAERDAAALSLVHRQLNPSTGEAPIPQAQLSEAIKVASPAVKVTIFDQAQTLRSDNWRDAEVKPVMERTIPVFRALIESEPRRFHRYHGQLGYALKDQSTPAWAEAEAELSTAIEIRGPWQEKGWLFSSSTEPSAASVRT